VHGSHLGTRPCCSRQAGAQQAQQGDAGCAAADERLWGRYQAQALLLGGERKRENRNRGESEVEGGRGTLAVRRLMSASGADIRPRRCCYLGGGQGKRG
jgi:hypothetical protein